MPDYRKSIVKIYCKQKKYKERFPWMPPEIEKCTGTGFIIHDNKIITNAHVISGNSFIEIKLANDTKRYIAEALYTGDDCDLAMLTVDSDIFWRDVIPLNLGGIVEANQQVNVYGFPLGGIELSITQGIVSRIDVTCYSYGNNELLDIQVDAAINPGNSGGPAIAGENVVGVAHQGINGGQNIGYIIPASIVKQFITNCSQGIYRGIPCISLEVQNLESDIARDYFNLTPEQTGVRISHIDCYSDAKGFLQVGDILLEIDSFKISNDGSIYLMSNVRANFKQAIKRRNIGDIIPVKFIRDRFIQTVNIPLLKKGDATYLVPHDYFGRQPSYFILSGIIFQCMTMSYIQEISISTDYNDLLHFIERHYIDHLRHEVVFINEILQCADTAGYDNVTNSVVLKVNGVKIKNIVDVIEASETNSLPFHVIETKGGNKFIVKNYYITEESLSKFKSLLTTYQIQQDRSNSLLDVKSREKYLEKFPINIKYGCEFAMDSSNSQSSLDDQNIVKSYNSEILQREVPLSEINLGTEECQAIINKEINIVVSGKLLIIFDNYIEDRIAQTSLNSNIFEIIKDAVNSNLSFTSKGIYAVIDKDGVKICSCNCVAIQLINNSGEQSLTKEKSAVIIQTQWKLYIAKKIHDNNVENHNNLLRERFNI